MEEKNGNLNNIDSMSGEDVRAEYFDTYNTLPSIPMMLCSGFDDDEYIAMLRYCLKNNTPVTEEIEEKFFPMEKDADY